MIILAAPEFIELVLGKKWLPMTLTFQLMIVYLAIDPLMAGIHQLFLSVGHPGVIRHVRTIQLIFFIPAVILLSIWQGIHGVALAADLMVVVGLSCSAKKSNNLSTSHGAFFSSGLSAA